MTDRNSPSTSTQSYRHGAPISRRAALSVGGAGLLASLAGCTSITGQSSNGPSSGSNGVFQNISFEGQQMVVELAEDHGVQKLNLIGPDGQEYQSTTLSRGETKATIPVLEITAGDPSHYPIGETRLVAVLDDDEVTKTLEMKPQLEIEKVSLHSGKEPKSHGNVRVAVKNTGSGPTWVYDVSFENAPNRTAKNTGDGSGSPSLYLIEPESKEETIIQPGESQTYVGQYPPFIFDKKSDCNSKSYEAQLIVKTGAKTSISGPIRAHFSGNPVRADSTATGDTYACKSGEVDLDGESNE